MNNYSPSVIFALHLFWSLYWWGACFAFVYKVFKISDERISQKYFYASYVFGIIAIIVSRG